MACCAVFGCFNNQKRKEDVQFFRFPRESDLCKQWVEFCKTNKTLNVTNARICSIHFSKDAFYKVLQHKLLNYSPKNRRKLKLTAIPTENGPVNPPFLEQSGPSNVQYVDMRPSKTITLIKSPSSLHSNVVCTPLNETSPAKKGSSEKSFLREETAEPDNLRRSRKRLFSDTEIGTEDFCKCEWKKKFEEMKILKEQTEKENKRLKKDITQKTVEHTTMKGAISKIFTPGQVKALISQKRVKWTSEDISSAISLRSVSPKGYRYLRNHCNFPLPALSTLRKWALKMDVRPGLLNDVLLLMRHKASTLSEFERITVLSFDEMFVDNQILLDKGVEQVLGPCKAVQVLMSRGLFGKWKQPVFYQFDQQLKQEILFNAITNLHTYGYCVVAIVSDMGTGNISLWNELGISLRKTSFVHPSDSTKLIFVFADAPHLLKLLRNHFLDHGYVLFDKLLTKTCIESILQLSNTSDLKICHKVTQHHLDVKGNQRQRVKLATQLFSNTVSNAIKWCGDQKLINEQYYQETADFIKLVNDWFDIFNSQVKYSTSGANAYGTDLASQNSIIDRMSTVMFNLRAVRKTSLLPFQKGILISNNSLKQLFQYLQNFYKIDYLENFFSYIRAMGASNDNPNPVDFKYRLRWYILGKHSSSAFTINKNCEEDHDESLTSPLEQNEEICLTQSLFMSIIEEADTQDLSENTTINEEQYPLPFDLPNTKIHSEAMKYLAGYVAHRFRVKYPFLGTETSKLPSLSGQTDWVNFVSKGKLLYPSHEFLKVCQQMETIFLSFHGSSINKEGNVVKKVVDFLKASSAISKEIPEEVLLCLVRTRTYIRIRELNKERLIAINERKTLRKKSKLPAMKKN